MGFSCIRKVLQIFQGDRNGCCTQSNGLKDTAASGTKVFNVVRICGYCDSLDYYRAVVSEDLVFLKSSSIFIQIRS